MMTSLLKLIGIEGTDDKKYFSRQQFGAMAAEALGNGLRGYLCRSVSATRLPGTRHPGLSWQAVRKIFEGL